jgi:hypothetical protein
MPLWDGIEQRCRVGFSQHHFVAHSKTFDKTTLQVAEVYSAGSSSPSIKRKMWQHNMVGCCLAAHISDFPSAGKYTSKAATSF